MAMTRSFAVGDAIPPLSKTMTQEAINLFEKSGGKTVPRTPCAVASGRMSLTFGTELLRRYFGPDVYNRGGVVELRFLRPVRPGDTMTFGGKVTDIGKVTNGVRVSVEVNATNQKGDVTAAGTGSCIVPSLW